MNKEEILKNAKKLFDVYLSIPSDALINSITGESVLNSSSDKEYETNLHTPYGMIMQRKEEEISVSFIPVYYYNDKTIGMYVSYYNVKTSKSLKVGPFKTPEMMTDALYEYIDLPAMSYIISSLKTDAGFANSYENVKKQYSTKIKSLVKLPLMQVFEQDSFLGPVLIVATRYVNNPYAYNDVKMEVIRIDGFSGTVSIHYNEPIAYNSSKLGDKLWDTFSYKDSKDTLTAAIKKIKEARKKEDEYIKMIKELRNE